MRQLGDQAQRVGLLHRHRVLAQPDAVLDERITTGIHDAIQAGVPAFGEGIFSVPGNRLYRSLHVEQGLCHISNVF